MRKDTIVNVRVNKEQLDRLKKSLGVDESKTVRACMNCTDFVIQNLFGGEIQHIFRRARKDETKDKYQF